MKFFSLQLSGVLFLLFLLTASQNTTMASSESFPPIGPIQYIGETKIGKDLISVYIADDTAINIMIHGKYYTKEDRKWTAKVLMVYNTEEAKQFFVNIINESSSDDSWVINNQFSLPLNNEFWALREDISFYPNDKIIAMTGAWAYSMNGEMIGFHKNLITKNIGCYYGQGEMGKMYAPICDLVSEYMEKRYQDEMTNLQALRVKLKK